MRGGLSERVLAYLRAHHVMTLATHGAGGPWAAAVFYANEGFDLYFLSSPASRHGLDLAANSRAAATIQRDYADWPQIQGVQMEGVVTLLQGAPEKRARDLYGGKFPLVRGAAGMPAAIAAALNKVRWYRLAPSRLYFVDNAAGFGRRDEIDLPPSAPR